MLNLKTLLKNIPDLEDKVFYSPALGDCKVSFDEDDEIVAESIIGYSDIYLNEYGQYGEYGECLLFLNEDKQESDWMHLLPFSKFDKVIGKTEEHDDWKLDVFLHLEDDLDGRIFKCSFGNYKYCLPFEGNKDLYLKQ